MRSKANLLTGMQGVNQNCFYIAGGKCKKLNGIMFDNKNYSPGKPQFFKQRYDHDRS